MADPLRPDTRPKSRWRKPMPRTFEHPAADSDGKGNTTSEGDEIRARLLQMIVENEEARKPKSR